MRNKRVLITGGLGFIGSHLVEEISPENEVVILDNKSSGKIENINGAFHDNINLIIGDITKFNLDEILEGIDYVFHHAALASVPASVADPLICNHVNVTGTLRLLVAARDAMVKKVVFASSSAVYGNANEMPISEKSLLRPMSPYAVSKLTGELYCQSFTEVYRLPTISLRYFNVFGPRQDPKSQYAAAVPNFIHKTLENKQPIIYGDGEQTRDFIYVKEVAKANLMAAESDNTGIYNIASGKSTSVNQLVEKISEVMGKEIEPIYAEKRPGDVKHSLAETSLAKKFGFECKGNFKEYLMDTVDSFRIEKGKNS